MSKPGRKPVHQLQYLPGSDGERPCPGTTAGVWENCVSDTAHGGSVIGPASKLKATAGMREMNILYPRVSYRIINLNDVTE